MRGLGFHLVKYKKGKGNLSFRSVKKILKGLTDTFCGCERDKKSFCSGYILRDGAITAVKRDACVLN